MNIALIGSGGREHAICRKLHDSKSCKSCDGGDWTSTRTQILALLLHGLVWTSPKLHGDKECSIMCLLI